MAAEHSGWIFVFFRDIKFSMSVKIHPEMKEAVPEGPFLKRADRGGSAM